MKYSINRNNVHPLIHQIKNRPHNRRNQQTLFIGLDTRKCRACWNCIDSCPEKVFGRINIIIRRHAVIADGDKCIGCGKCVNACNHGALYSLKNQIKINVKEVKK